ncbi:MAG: hypothetical protein JWL97_3571 [Gemmatimonadales bacterium]|nr:hypothetical protein [Gemmatimonadales bacterium]
MEKYSTDKSTKSALAGQIEKSINESPISIYIKRRHLSKESLRATIRTDSIAADAQEVHSFEEYSHSTDIFINGMRVLDKFFGGPTESDYLARVFSGILFILVLLSLFSSVFVTTSYVVGGVFGSLIGFLLPDKRFKFKALLTANLVVVLLTPQVLTHEIRYFWLPVMVVTITALAYYVTIPETGLSAISMFAGAFYGPVVAINYCIAKSIEKRWLNEVKGEVIIPELIRSVNSVLGDDYERLLVEHDARGLKRLYDKSLLVSTSSETRVKTTLRRSEGASIAVAGPRGSGKSTLLKSLVDSNSGVALVIAAPAEYSPKEFLVELFQCICEEYISCRGYSFSRVGNYSLVKRTRLGFVYSALKIIARIILSLCLFTVLAFSVYRELATSATSAYRSSWQISRSVYQSVLTFSDTHPRVWQLVLAILCFVIFPKRWKHARFKLEPKLVSLARNHLVQLRVEKTVTWGATANTPIIQGSINRGSSIKYLPWSMPEIVGHLRRFLDEISREAKLDGGRVLIAIDEVDRISDLNQAERFIGEIKTIFGIANCFFLVSVAEEVGSVFARRALAGRSVFENAFDEIVSVHALSLTEAQELLQKRVLGMTDSFLYLTYALSGGIPREVIRVARRLVEINSDYHQVRLHEFSRRLIQEEMYEAIDGTRSLLSNLQLSSEWGDVFSSLETLRESFEQKTVASEVHQSLTSLAQRSYVLSTEIRTSAPAAIQAIEALSALAFLGLTTVEAFGHTAFDLSLVRDRSIEGGAGSYARLAKARRELSISTQSSRNILNVFRAANGIPHPHNNL